VLGRTSSAERAPVEQVLPLGADAITAMLEQGAERAMQQLHTSPSPAAGRD
jgi:peptidyl-tRNA hydrolase